MRSPAAATLLLKLDLRDRQARLEQARAGVNQQEASYKGQLELKPKGYVSDTQLAETLAKLETARAELTRAELDLEYMHIRAPFNGMVQERNVEIGDYVRAGDPVATFVDNTHLIVTGSIAEQDAGFVRVGTVATAHLVTGEVVSGKIRYIAPVADEATRTFTVELELPNPGGKLPAGVTTEMRIPAGKVLAYQISPSLLTLDAEGELGVKTVDADGKVVFNRITIAQSGSNGIWVTGLPDQANIIVVGQGYVSAGQAVKAVPAKAAEPGGCRPDRDPAPMNALIDLCVSRSRAVLVALFVLLAAGAVSYRGIPKEAQPDVDFPYISVMVMLDGVSAEDSERLLVRPLEQQLRNIEGIKEMVASATENRASITLEFEPEIDIDQALTNVRERVDQAKAELPEDAREPTVNEIKFSQFDPMMVINLGGDLPERSMNAIARKLQDRLQAVDGVLEVNLVGIRDEVLEIVINPLTMESYGLSPADVLNFVQRNNRLVAAGALQSEQGRFAVKVPGLIESPEDLLSLPLKVDGQKVVYFRDIAQVRRTFKDPESYARLNGNPAVGIRVVQRNGSNLLDVAANIKQVVAETQKSWPPGITLTYSRDKSIFVRDDVNQLVNDVVVAVLLVVICLIGILGLQNALLAGISIPGSFCAAFLLLDMGDMTMNMVVFFGLIMSVGLVVDGGIVVVELADRRMAEGLERPHGLCRGRQAHGLADLRLDLGHHRRLPAAGLLAGADRQLPQVDADRAGLHAGRLAAHRDVRGAGTRFDIRPCRASHPGEPAPADAGRNRRPGPDRWLDRPLSAHRHARGQSPRPHGGDADRPAHPRVHHLWLPRSRRHAVSARRSLAGQRRHPRPRRPVHPGEGPAGAPGRAAHRTASRASTPPMPVPARAMPVHRPTRSARSA